MPRIRGHRMSDDAMRHRNCGAIIADPMVILPVKEDEVEWLEGWGDVTAIREAYAE